MKKFVNLLFFILLTNSLWGQGCNQAISINNSDKTIQPSTFCDSNNSIFTFILSDSILINSGVQINIVSYKGNGYGDAFTTHVFGPFSTLTEGCNFINTNSPTDYNSYQDLQGFQSVEIDPSSWTNNKFYILKTDFTNCFNGLKIKKTFQQPREWPPSGDGSQCLDCLPKFSPPQGKYVVSAWVKEKDAPVTKVQYSNSIIELYDGTTLIDQFIPIGNIIDGWQKIEGVFQLGNTTNIQLKLVTSGSVTAYFDDIRIQPFNSSMITYVYDPLTLRLVAELDDRNYAKIYEYDEEGKLIRIKKETEKGIMTIQETRENSSK